MAAYDDLNVRRIAVISVISVLITAVSVLAIQVLYFAMAEVVDNRKIRSASYRRQNQILDAQASELGRYGVDPMTGKVTIPIDQAIKQIAEQSESTAASNDQASL